MYKAVVYTTADRILSSGSLEAQIGREKRMIRQVEMLEGCLCGRENASLAIISFSKNLILYFKKPLIFSNCSVALVETCPQLLPVSSSLPQVKECTFMYWHDLGYKFFCDFKTVSKSQTIGTLTYYLKIFIYSRSCPCHIWQYQISRALEGEKYFFSFLYSEFLLKTRRKNEVAGQGKKRRKYVEGVI